MSFLTHQETADNPAVSYRTCDNCGKPFDMKGITKMAPHKRFCSPKCANHWHYQNRTKPRRDILRDLDN